MGIETVSTASRYDAKTVKEGAEEMENDEQSFLDDTSCWCCFWGTRRPPKISHSNSLHDGSFDESEKTNKSERSSLSHWSSKGEEELLSSSQLRKFCFNDLKSATRNFRPDSLLGEGGFGCVFKGWIDEHGTAPVKPGTGLTVAVKILKQSGLQGHKEWLAELNFLGQLSHPNLAKLIGYCIEDDQRLLVYEFLQRGSLENHLFRKGALPLRWSTRMKIALGAAKGLAFLHSGDKPIIYRDFKTSNILLDSEYSPKLSDFGLARDGPAGDRTHVSTRVLGTHGYAAPEYIMTGHLTVKSDVYSYGVVLLEILTGKRAVDKRRPSGEHNLVEWMRPHLQDKKKLYKVLDPGLDSQSQCSPKALKTLANLAYRCTSRESKSRPLMPEVVQIMESVYNMRVTPPSTTTASIRTPTNSSTTPLFRQSIQRGPVTSTADKQCR